MTEDDPKPLSYRPFVAARHPLGKAPEKPLWRILVHKKHVDLWNRIAEVCGDSNAGELWLHLAMQPDQAPRLGTVTPMKGKHNGATSDGKSRVYHYEVSGAGRVDYRFCKDWKASKGDKHPVVWIVSIDLASH